MSEFIKLTLADGGPFYLPKSSPIIGMHRVVSPQNQGTVLLLGATNRVVTETPEEIMAMLEAKTNQFPGLMARLDEAIRQRDEAEQKNDVLSIAANKRLISANEILSVAVTAKTNQVEDLLKRLDQALQQRDEALLQNDELPAANKALKAVNNTLSVALAAKTIEIDDLTGRLSDALQLNCEVGRQLHEALQQRDEATQKNDEMPAANEALKSANEILFDTLTARTAQVDSLAGRLSNVLQLNGDLQAKTYNLNSDLHEALRQRDRFQHKLNSIKIVTE